MHTRLEPQILTVLREGYGRAALARDALAGVIVGIVALPLAIAFGIASGVKPEQGLAIVGGFRDRLRHPSSSPTPSPWASPAASRW